LTNANIRQAICEELGLIVSSAYLNLEYKIQSVMIYGFSGQILSAKFHNIENPAYAEQLQENIPARNQYSRLGYIWPLADQSIVIDSRNLTGNTFLTVYKTGATTDIALYKLKVLWRSTTPRVSQRLTIPRTSDNHADQLDRVTSALEQLTVTLRHREDVPRDASTHRQSSQSIDWLDGSASTVSE